MFYSSRSIQNNRMRGYNSTADMPKPAVYTTSKPPSGGSLDFANTLNNDCVGCWLFNEGAGSTVKDLSSAAKSGVLSGGDWGNPPTWSTNDGGLPCIAFDRFDSGNVKVDGWGLVAPTTEMTFLFRQYVNSATQQSTFHCVGGSGSTLNTHCPWEGNVVYWDAGNPSSRRISYTPSEMITGVWVTWIMTASATSTYSRIYRDGVLDHSDAITPGFTQTNSPLFIGSAAGQNFFGGKIDLLRVWNRALSTDEITTLSAAPFTGIGE